MTIERVPDTNLKYYLIAFDSDGSERQDDEDGLVSKLALDEASKKPLTDIFILAHGWKGDVPAAKAQYNAWIGAMAQCEQDIERLRASRPDFYPMLIGLHWPSLPWGDEKLSSGAASFAPEAAATVTALVDEYAARTADTERAREALKTIFEAARTDMNPLELPEDVKKAYEIINDEIALGADGEAGAPGNDRVEFDAEEAYQAGMEAQEIDFSGGILGGILSPLRQLSFWKMKDRARKFGETGAHDFLKRLQERTAPPRRIRIHLMGHSFGCIVVSSMIAGPSGKGRLPRQIDSVALVQGALSLWSYCSSIPFGEPGRPGYFNSIVSNRTVRGPIITTQSRHDTAVGRFYPLGAGIRGDVNFAWKYPKFGGLGAFGAQGLESEVENIRMLASESDYEFKPGKIYNIESSDFINQGDGASGAHSDIAKPEVAHAVWEAVRAAEEARREVPEMIPFNPDAAKPEDDSENEEFYPNGIFAGTGMPLPLDVEAAVSTVLKKFVKSEEAQVASDRIQSNQPAFAVSSEVDANNLAQAGWGVIFHSQASQEVKDALQPLLEHRSREAGKRYKVFDGSEGYQPGESALRWLARHKVRADIVEPAKGVPFYLLIVGSPEEIPFEFQYTLDVYWAVGRLYFDKTEDYAQYAKSVIAYETAAKVSNSKKVTIFSTSHDFDTATQMFSNFVALPLVKGDEFKEPLGEIFNFKLETFIGRTATKKNLSKILSGDSDGGPPALLFTGSHGMAFDKDDDRLAGAQGALVCQDWAGYGNLPTENDYYAASDVPKDAKMHGLIHFFFACYSAGCPMYDNFQKPIDKQQLKQISPKPLMSQLPQRLLSHPNGGALATLGHVDRAWSYSFHSARIGGQIQGFRDVMSRLMRGDRIGYATDQFDIRRVAVSDRLAELLRSVANEMEVSDKELLGVWIERNDARNYVVLGDPAVRLRVSDLVAS